MKDHPLIPSVWFMTRGHRDGHMLDAMVEIYFENAWKLTDAAKSTWDRGWECWYIVHAQMQVEWHRGGEGLENKEHVDALANRAHRHFMKKFGHVDELAMLEKYKAEADDRSNRRSSGRTSEGYTEGGGQGSSDAWNRWNRGVAQPPDRREHPDARASMGAVPPPPPGYAAEGSVAGYDASTIPRHRSHLFLSHRRRNSHCRSRAALSDYTRGPKRSKCMKFGGHTAPNTDARVHYSVVCMNTE